MKTLSTVFSLLFFMTINVSVVLAGDESLTPNRARAVAAMQQLQNEFPGVQLYQQNGRISQIYGRAFGSGQNPEEAAEQFRLNHAAVFLAETDDLRPISTLKDSRHILPLMYYPETDSYKFTLVYYSQYRDDIPVFRSDLRILVRNEPGYPVVMAVSALRDLADFKAADRFDVNFVSARSAALAAFPGLTDFSESETVIWAGDDAINASPRLAITFIGSNDIPEQWLFVADAVTGEILFQEDQILFDNVSGDVRGYATEGSAAEQCEEEILTPIPYVEVKTGSTTTYTDSGGYYLLDDVGSEPVIIESQLRGKYFVVTNLSADDAYLADTVQPPATADFIYNQTNEEFTRAEVNAYILANNVRDFVLKHNPSYPGVASRYDFPLFVNMTHENCSFGGAAYYDNIYEEIRFCRSVDIYPNAAFQSIVFHEYGHHLVNMAGSGQWVYGEGAGDVMAMMWADESGIGFGYEGDCEQPYRDGDNTFNYPCNVPPHACGMVLSGCVWEFRNELKITYPETYMDTVAKLFINSIPLHIGGYVTPAITRVFLVLDDDDANLANGTPHHDEICTGFARHNMGCPNLAPVLFDYPNGRPNIILEDSQTVIDVAILANTSEPVGSSGMLYYSIDGAPYQAVSMPEITSNEYEIILPATSCGSRINWYISVETIESGTLYNPAEAPAQTYLSASASGSLVILKDDFETDLGWTTWDSATDGEWIRGYPNLGTYGSDPFADFDGSGKCYLSDTAQEYSDVDSGTIYLLSPTVDISNGDALIHYARWFAIDEEDTFEPNSDEMNIYISNDNGANWTLIETIGSVEPVFGGWYENSFIAGDYITPSDEIMIRFEASDLNDRTTVEAGIDDVSMTLFICSEQLTILTNRVPDWTAGYYYEHQLVSAVGLGEVTWTDKYNDLAGSGLSLSPSGQLSGTPISAGPITFTAAAVDEEKGTAEKQFSFTINTPVNIVTDTLPWGVVDSMMSEPFLTNDGTPPLTWTDKNSDLIGTGLSILSTGFLAGAPDDTGTILFTALVEDAAGSIDEKLLSIKSVRTMICGDVNYDKVVNLFDITYLITYLYKGGFPPLPMESGDVNNDGNVNIFDVTYLIAYRYRDGPDPNCPEIVYFF